MQPSSATTGSARPQSYRPRNRRRILCVFPPYAPSFGTFQHAYRLMPGVRAFMPPQGLLVIAAYLPAQWEVRFVDSNIAPPSEAEFAWADAVLISGMHVQRESIGVINDAAHRHGKLTVLGGPSVSGCPEFYPDVDVLHLGELGDGTDALIEFIDRQVDRPDRQLRFRTTHRLPMEAFPQPAYGKLNLARYFLGSIQYSSGCPYQCEFCDIPALYGRRPRIKTPEQIHAELDALTAGGGVNAIYFVDDNFIGNRKATQELLPHLVDWQRRQGYPVEFCCEATLDIAQRPAILELMREAGFTTVFCGIETPEADALRAMAKKQNLRLPMVDAVRTLNGYGLEVVSGIILGLDTDTPRTGEAIIDFIDATQIPMLTINLLYALPQTALHRRLQAEGRLIDDPSRPSNVRFAMPEEQVIGMYRRCVEWAYRPENLLRRFAHQAQATYPNRLPVERRVSTRQIILGIGVLSRVLWNVGIGADYRSEFWRVAGPLLKAGRIEDAVHIAVVAHHLIRFSRDALGGRGELCFYTDSVEEAVG